MSIIFRVPFQMLKIQQCLFFTLCRVNFICVCIEDYTEKVPNYFFAAHFLYYRNQIFVFEIRIHQVWNYNMNRPASSFSCASFLLQLKTKPNERSFENWQFCVYFIMNAYVISPFKIICWWSQALRN